jgi:hypothetical protein
MRYNVPSATASYLGGPGFSHRPNDSYALRVPFLEFLP